jgi:hypothetical protein
MQCSLEDVNMGTATAYAGAILMEYWVQFVVQSSCIAILANATEYMRDLFLVLFGFVLDIRLDNLRAAFVAVQAVIACELIRVVLDHLILGRQASSIAALDTKDSTICDVAYWGQLRK